MPQVYRYADIVLIPTKAAEGTSLSCLEAMASGRAVIAGCVGGLSDLIVDGYNGLLLRPLTGGIWRTPSAVSWIVQTSAAA